VRPRKPQQPKEPKAQGKIGMITDIDVKPVTITKSGPGRPKFTMKADATAGYGADGAASGQVGQVDVEAKGNLVLGGKLKNELKGDVTKTGIELDADLKEQVGIVGTQKIVLTSGPVKSTTKVQELLGAEAGAKFGVDADLAKGELKGGGEVGAFVGAKIEGEQKLDVAGIEVGVKGAAEAGAGATAGVQFAVGPDEIVLGAQLGASIGVGAAGGTTIAIHPDEVVANFVDSFSPTQSPSGGGGW
jgi:hypothetical protein